MLTSSCCTSHPRGLSSLAVLTSCNQTHASHINILLHTTTAFYLCTLKYNACNACCAQERRGLHVNVADLLDALQYAAKIKHQVSLTQLNAMLTEVQPQLPSFTTPQLVEAVRCLGAVCVEPEEGFMQQVLDKLQPQLAQLGISQLANLSWGLSRLGPPHQLTDQWLQLYVEAVAAQVHQLPAGMGNKQLARQLAVMLLLPAKCGCTPSQSWLQQYQQAVAGCLAKASTQDIADYLSCLTRYGWQHLMLWLDCVCEL